jgi:small-conductance mechanosensitive channel
MIPWPLGLVASLFTNNAKKWRDMGKQLEVPVTIFFWWLGIEISFLPTMTNHHTNGNRATKEWERTLNKILISLFVGATLNFVEKIIIQLIAISFHLRTYADRIDINKFQIGSLTKLYTFSKQKIVMDDSDFEEEAGMSKSGSGARTPMAYVDKAQKATKEAFSKVGDVAGAVAGDFTGKAIAKSSHPHQVVLTLLHTTGGSQVLARRLYRTFVRDGFETVFSGDLKSAFDNEDEAEAAFSMFDKDLNGDISMEELEAVCVEIGRERKSITASLKDLDSVVSKLDDVFVFVVVVITLLVLLSLLSTSAAGVLTSAGSTILALSWLFAATAQEFLQSVIFVFVKHPFDVGDRVSIYGNTGSTLKGDDYFVKEIALLYTEFKKLEGHVVQAPNSYLNTLFILNMRRSGGLAEAVPVTVKFGTTLQQIDDLRQQLLEFVKAEKREYQGNILTELRDITDAYSITLNVVFFYKSNWQNELLRLQRRNKFICAMMVAMQDLGIEGPRMRHPGQKEESPLYLSYHGTPPQYSTSDPNSKAPASEPIVPLQTTSTSSQHHQSILRNRGPGSAARPRGESISSLSKRVDFSLGMRDMSSGDTFSDVYDDRSRTRAAEYVRSTSRITEESEPDDSSKQRTSTSQPRRSSSSAVGPSQLNRVSTDSARTNHRNRFFGRHRGSSNERAEREDLMEQGMSDITEVIDPRSGIVTPLAVQRDGSVSGNVEPVRWVGNHTGGVGRSQTEDFEMRRLRNQ